MQREEAGSHCGAMDTNILHAGLIPLGYTDSVDKQAKNQLMLGFPLPLSLGEAMNDYSSGQTSTVADSAEFWNAEPARGIRGFALVSDQFLALPGTFACPLTDNSSDIVNSSFETTSNTYEEGLPFGASNRWDFSNLLHPVVGVPPLEPTGNYVNHDWIVTEQREGTPRSNNKLSLSLAMSQSAALHGTAIHDQCSEMSSSGITSYSLHKRPSEHGSLSSSNLSMSIDSQSPPQISSLLSGSRFFHAMQEVLAEIACYALETFDGSCYSSTGVNNGVDFSEGNKQIMLQNGSSQERDIEAKKKHLLNLLQVVDDRYNQCLDEIHTVVSAFDAVTELDPSLHARFALPTISFMYKNLRERISSHILSMGTHYHSPGDSVDKESSGFLQKQWALQQLRKRDHQLWRPQRGLPERSVSVLRAWMFQNFLHPYPKDAEKHLLAVKSGLTRSQVSNWFINARVRLWKPMIEEMDAEINRRKASRRNNEEEEGNESNDMHRNHMHFEGRRFTMN